VPRQTFIYKIRQAVLTSKCVLGDCIPEMWRHPSGFTPLVIADPPYNFGMAYDNYDDNKEPDEYMAWTSRWLEAARHALHKHGSLFLFIPDDWVSEIDVLARKKFKFYKRRHIVWTFTFGQASQKNFSKSHCHILYLTCSKTKFTFNADAIRVPSARMLVYNDSRQNPKGKLPDATWMLLKSQMEPYMTPDTDTWLDSRINGTFKERKAHSPNQIPVPIMSRIIRVASNPGDLVLDPFMGTAGCGEAAKIEKRSYLGIDVSKACVKDAQKRLICY